jgi:hypothetical protein
MNELNNPAVNAPELGQAVTPEPVVQEESTSLTIDGIGEVSFDDIKEWKNGYLRQDDYTRKTQALADEKKKLALSQVTTAPEPAHNSDVASTDPGLAKIQQEMSEMYLDIKMRDMRSKYGDSFDEIAVLTKASEMIQAGTPQSVVDFDFIHNGLVGSNSGVDEAGLREQIKKQILSEMQESQVDTSSLIGGGGDPPVEKNLNLTQEEIAFANRIGMSPEEYASWKQ